MSETQNTETSSPEKDTPTSPPPEKENTAPTDKKEEASTISLSKNDTETSPPETPPGYNDTVDDKQEAPFHSKWADVFNACAKIGPLYILFFICLMVWPDYFQKGTGIFCPPEIRSVTAFLHCIQDSSWLAPIALDNGVWSIPQWPLFYIYIGLLALIPGLAEANWLIPLACASSAAIALLGAFFFTHAAGFGVGAAFASALILLCAPIFAPLHHFFGPITLATGLMLFSLALFCRGWRAHRAWISLPLAFIFAGLAGLCGGVLYVAVPFLGSFFYLIWQGNYRRGQALDAITGFLLMLIIIGAWIGAITLGDYPDFYLSKLFADSIDFTWPPPHFWYLALIAGAAGLVPWTLSIFGVSWIRVLKDSVKSFSASRHENGSALMWISLALACCLSLFIPHTPVAAITIGALLAPLLGKAFVRLSPIGNRFFFFLASVLVILVGCVLLAIHFEASQKIILNILPVQPPSFVTNELLQLNAVPIIGAVLIVAGLCGFFFVKRARGGGGMIYASIVAVIIAQVALFMVAPALQDNPALPLKKIDAIAQEVEKAKVAEPSPETKQETPLPAETKQEPRPSETPAPDRPVTETPESSTPDNSGEASQPAPLPKLTIPPENLLPGQENPDQKQPEEPASPPAEEPQAAPEGPGQNAPDNPGTPQNITEVPQIDSQEVIIVEEEARKPEDKAAD